MIADNGSAFRSEPFPEPELTPAASEKLNQNIHYLRLQILREISRQHGGSGYRARASDVESAVDRINLFDSAPQLVSRTALLAICLACASLIAELVNQVKRPSALWLVSGISVLVGITSGTAIVVIIQEARRRRRVPLAAMQEFIRAFASLEESMRRSARELLGPIAETTSLGRIISAIELLQLWTPEESQAFRRVLSARNSIVYEDKSAIRFDKIASEFSQVTRLASLLDNAVGSVSGSRIKKFQANRAALSFEERVTNALRRAGIGVSSAPRDAGYDLLAGNADLLKGIIIKYRRSGPLTVSDVTSAIEQLHSGVPIVIVTNASISPHVNEYLELVYAGSDHEQQVSVIRWHNNEDATVLVGAVTAVDE